MRLSWATAWGLALLAVVHVSAAPALAATRPTKPRAPTAGPTAKPTAQDANLSCMASADCPAGTRCVFKQPDVPDVPGACFKTIPCKASTDCGSPFLQCSKQRKGGVCIPKTGLDTSGLVPCGGPNGSGVCSSSQVCMPDPTAFCDPLSLPAGACPGFCVPLVSNPCPHGQCPSRDRCLACNGPFPPYKIPFCVTRNNYKPTCPGAS